MNAVAPAPSSHALCKPAHGAGRVGWRHAHRAPKRGVGWCVGVAGVLLFGLASGCGGEGCGAPPSPLTELAAPSLPSAVETAACAEAAALLRDGVDRPDAAELAALAEVLLQRSASDRELLDAGMRLAQAGPEGHAAIRASAEMLGDALGASLVHGRLLQMAAGWPLAFVAELFPPAGGCHPVSVRPECVAALVHLLAVAPGHADRFAASPVLELVRAEAALSRGEEGARAWNDAVLALSQDRLGLAQASWTRLGGAGLRVPATAAARVRLASRSGSADGRRQRVEIALSLLEVPGDGAELGELLSPALARSGIPADQRAALLAAWWVADPEARTAARRAELEALAARAGGARLVVAMALAVADGGALEEGADRADAEPDEAELTDEESDPELADPELADAELADAESADAMSRGVDAMVRLLGAETVRLEEVSQALEASGMRGSYRRTAIALLARRHGASLGAAIAQAPGPALTLLHTGDRALLLAHLSADAEAVAEALHAAAGGDPAAWLAGFAPSEEEARAALRAVVAGWLRGEEPEDRALVRTAAQLLAERRGAIALDGDLLLERAMQPLPRAERGGQGEATRRQLALLAMRAEPSPGLDVAIAARRAQEPARGAFEESVLLLHDAWHRRCAPISEP